MTSYTDRGPRPPKNVTYLGFDHVHMWVGNAAQSAAYYVSRFGFEPLALKSLETGERDVASYAVRQGNVVFVCSSALNPNNREFERHISRHGDGVKDVAFRVQDCRATFEFAVKNGATVVREPELLKDEHGSVVIATIRAGFGDSWHSFVERRDYRGAFLPGYRSQEQDDPLITITPSPGIKYLDHCVSNNGDGEMQAVVRFYIDVLGFHRYWSVDDSQIHTEYSSLRSIVVCDYDERIKMPVNEPAPGRGKSQIQEFVEYYDGPGIQHIALNTGNIIHAITYLRQRGVNFIQVPQTYYEDLRQRLASQSSVEVKEDLDKLQSLGILIDFDDVGYLLQIFTRPLNTRPTLFLEVIQRQQNNGFGVGNFKSLFEAIERDQAKRGNL
eukprot:Plantae.Rhodophyta-Purpureofilum_apyrenoidigerum.ctg2646.p1 GENE.Plantae.Rhodophyta-Purpureofilum_apyrenoidigerum.ctg2646~~Plantae.Rhodophyta-Purpureofilum_apyrenoidigerum.ctg2646.p1  ORF type:complete len:385 (+),score=46.64 Plantae.Rhodophyta-Purpureofilum_apyrenoidigerum.ctg2646:290-1444(+)